MAGMTMFPGANSFQVDNVLYKASLNLDILPQYVFLQRNWRTLGVSNFCNGSKSPLLRSSKYFLKKQRAIGTAFAASAGQADPVVSIQSDDEVNFTSEPFGETKLRITVSVTSKGTQKAFNEVLDSLGKSAPPVKGFRKGKGGKSLIARNLLYQMLVPSRVDRFVVEETVTSTILEYVKKEDIKVKKDFKTVQSTDELITAFKAGKEFEFDAILELEEMAETASTSDLES